MANVTLYVSDELKKRMAARSDIRWSRAFSTFVEEKLDDFERADFLAQKSKLTQADVDRIAAKVDNSMGRRVKKLLDEGRY